MRMKCWRQDDGVHALTVVIISPAYNVDTRTLHCTSWTMIK